MVYRNNSGAEQTGHSKLKGTAIFEKCGQQNLLNTSDFTV